MKIGTILEEVTDEDIIDGVFFVPDNITEIGNYAFRCCKSLVGVVISKSVVEICDSVFSGCENLKNVIIPEGVKFIGDRVFNNCLSLEHLTLPDSLSFWDGDIIL